MQRSYVIGLVVLIMAASVGITLWATSNKPPSNPPTPSPRIEPSPCPTPDTQTINSLIERLSRQAAQVTQTIEAEKQGVQKEINEFTKVLTRHQEEWEKNQTTSFRKAAEQNLRESEKKMARLEGKKEALAALSPKVTAALTAPEPSPSASVGGAGGTQSPR
jgi:uncharacterized membrane protein YccC